MGIWKMRVHFVLLDIYVIYNDLLSATRFKPKLILTTTITLKLCSFCLFIFRQSKNIQWKCKSWSNVTLQLQQKLKIYANYTRQHVWCNDINSPVSFVNRKIKMMWHPRSKNRSTYFRDLALRQVVDRSRKTSKLRWKWWRRFYHAGWHWGN